ncbi:amidase [Phaeobacter gallaeciensis]|uniref:Amidase n=1 Tax=Phaeobacter gallaeciensis TaxID=60890 RepID=A0A1B0ZSB4_9RHOB|nr:MULTISPECIES: acetamidase/formamidase family protein [Phaeobacter]ANP37061.1 amidase [Phaeobacter gallaeciensis]MDE4061056.1 acetamidase/formamidase family protein [Phaeobacter gallaeciensis]MDE4124151.1 acetamidase/formamidase family protein [Phaeobacter gallaeciensis]MDE4128621.1 acetamidase/formamidase family protein [Phaeobacter gallaeciensis]MDE4305010.1 acetamidase/formamidase family protein [Phaeobacter gallaeciensis]
MTSTLPASVQSCHWGFFDAAHPPALSIDSGEEVIIDTVSGGPDMLPGDGFHVPPELLEIHAAGLPGMPGHILTGPVEVRGAQPGDVLQVDILDISLRQDWGYNMIRPLAGTLPLEFPKRQRTILPLDAERQLAHLPWGTDLPLAPFFGVMGVAPPPEWGRISTIEPRRHGGNIDNKELIAGTTLYLPVLAPGALFSCGDGHAAQGDGEVCVTAIETALRGHFRLTLRRDLSLDYPQAETPSHHITMGMHADLDVCAEMALRDMIAVAEARLGISREDAYMLCSLAADLRITQTVNREKGVHMMMPKSQLQRP